MNIAQDLANRTEDAYSVDRYRSWLGCARLLLKTYSEKEAEVILRSKHMRWAADAHSAPWGNVPTTALAKHLKDKANRRHIKDMFKEEGL
jgi:hypothetical protein